MFTPLYRSEANFKFFQLCSQLSKVCECLQVLARETYANLKPKQFIEKPFSLSMEPLELPSAADDIRKEMIALIPDVRIYDEDEKGNKKYGGDEIAGLVSRMKAALNLDEVGINARLFYGTSLISLDLGRTLEILVDFYETGQYWKERISYSNIGQNAGVPWGFVEGRVLYTSPE